MGAAVLLADLVYNVPANVIVDSARRALTGYDVVTSMVKSWVFGTVVATVSGTGGPAVQAGAEKVCNWKGWGKHIAAQAECGCQVQCWMGARGGGQVGWGK